MSYRVIEKSIGNNTVIEYGITEGSSLMIFIKAGRGGSCRGYEDKYIKMADALNSQYGCTVICASNPVEVYDTYAYDSEVVSCYVSEKCFSECEIYFIGSSDGARQGLIWATKEKAIRRLLLINMPLMIDFHKTEARLRELSDRKITAVFGEKDPSYIYVPFLNEFSLSYLDIMIAKNADHCFTGMLREFIALPFLLF